jgi:chaperonin GroEL
MKILNGLDARKKIKEGVDICCDAVKISLGHNGKNALISNGEVVDIVNDGVTIAKFVETKDEVQLAGIRLAQQCAAMTNQVAGDGTTTTLVLLQSFLNELLSETQLEQPRELRKKVLDSVEKVIEKLDKQVKAVKPTDIESIATTSCLDPEVGKLIANIFKKLGNDASITLEETRYNTISGKITEGFQFDSKYVNLYKEDKVELLDTPVAIFDKNVTQQDIITKIVALRKEGESQLLVIAGTFAKDIIGAATKFNAQGEFMLHLVQNSELNGDDLRSIGNKVKKAVVTDSSTTLIGGNGDVKKHIETLKEKLAKEESTFQKELLDRRISALTAGVAVITVGGVTDTEREERKLKVEDAINTTKAALAFGYIPGGGIALRDAGRGEFIETVCGSVYKQICENSEEEVKVGKEIKDSILTIKSALRSAASIATSILTAEVALVTEDDK